MKIGDRVLHKKYGKGTVIVFQAKEPTSSKPKIYTNAQASRGVSGFKRDFIGVKYDDPGVCKLYRDGNGIYYQFITSDDFLVLQEE